MGMKVLITGCQGFIAKNLAQHLKKQGHYVVGIDKKLKTNDQMSNYLDFLKHYQENHMESHQFQMLLLLSILVVDMLEPQKIVLIQDITGLIPTI